MSKRLEELEKEISKLHESRQETANKIEEQIKNLSKERIKKYEEILNALIKKDSS
jgi:hypothetical protein